MKRPGFLKELILLIRMNKKETMKGVISNVPGWFVENTYKRAQTVRKGGNVK